MSLNKYQFFTKVLRIAYILLRKQRREERERKKERKGIESKEMAEIEQEKKRKKPIKPYHRIKAHANPRSDYNFD